MPHQCALTVHHIGVQARIRGGKTGFGQRLRQGQAVEGVHIHRAQQHVNLDLQPVLHRFHRAVAECPIQGQAGQAKKGGQHDAGGDQQTAVEGTHRLQVAERSRRIR